VNHGRHSTSPGEHKLRLANSGSSCSGVKNSPLHNSALVCNDGEMQKIRDSGVSYFGRTNHRNSNIRFGIKQADRLSHVYVIGKTGVGKSSLSRNACRAGRCRRSWSCSH